MKRGEVPIQGTKRNNPVGLKLGFADEDYGYAIDLGILADSDGAFGLDPAIKAEAVWAGQCRQRSNVFAERTRGRVAILDAAGRRKAVMTDLASYDSMMTHATDPGSAPELLYLRERMRAGRFYDHFRTDQGAPTRRPQIGTRTPILASDRADLAAALQTIIEIGDRRGLEETIEDAFPGSSVAVGVSDNGFFEVQMRQPGLLRPLTAAEFSDGTLRYLLLVAALLSPRPPSLLVLNEPETSLHPVLIAPLGRLIGRAAEQSQVIVSPTRRRLPRCWRGSGERCPSPSPRNSGKRWSWRIIRGRDGRGHLAEPFDAITKSSRIAGGGGRSRLNRPLGESSQHPARWRNRRPDSRARSPVPARRARNPGRDSLS